MTISTHINERQIDVGRSTSYHNFVYKRDSSTLQKYYQFEYFITLKHNQVSVFFLFLSHKAQIIMSNLRTYKILNIYKSFAQQT